MDEPQTEEPVPQKEPPDPQTEELEERRRALPQVRTGMAPTPRMPPMPPGD